MITKNKQINPRSSRVDFSHLRKYGLGGITKYEEPVHGITYREGTSWQGDVFSKFKDSLLAILGDPNATPEQKQQAVAAINEMQNAYAAIRQAHPNLDKVTFDNEVKKYQQSIIDKYNFVNTKGIANGLSSTTNRYVFGQTDPNKRISQDKAGENGTWGTDGLYGGQTQDRTLLGYEGDWDETSPEYQAWQKQLNQYGLETYKGENGAYLLREKTAATPTPATPTPATPTPATPAQEESGNPEDGPKSPYEALTFQKPPEFKKGVFDSPIQNAVTAANTIGAAQRSYDLAMQKKVALPEATYQQYAVTDNWLGQQNAANQAAEMRSAGARLQGSSAEDNTTTALRAEELAQKYEQQGQEDKNYAYNKSIQEATNVANANNAESVDIANRRKSILTEDWNRRINAKDALQETIATTLNDMHQKNTADWKSFNAQENKRYDQYINNLNQYDANIADQKAKQGYMDLYQHPENSNAFKTAYGTIYNAWKDPANSNQAFDILFTKEDGSELSEEEKRRNVLAYLQQHPEVAEATAFNNGYNAELDQAYTDYDAKRQEIQNQLQYASIGIPNSYSAFNWNPYQSNVQRVQFEKSGGRVSRKVNDRMYRYLEHNRKVNQEIADYSLKAGKMLQDQLNKRLDQLDRETLLLLRKIFK